METAAGVQLVGYVSAVEGYSLDAVQLRSILAQSLPDHMVPSAIVALENLPLSPNGKVDRKALPEPEFKPLTQYEPPQGETEEMLAQIWSEVLGVERVGRRDNFFELGGHSLMAIRLVETMRRKIVVSPPVGVNDIYSFPTIQKMASRKGQTHTSIVHLNHFKRSELPLIVIHDGYGSVLDYTKLAEALDERCPVIALPYRYNPDVHQYESLYTLARAHAETIIEAGIEAPYRLCGWSLGGAIAPLVAGFLESEGKQVDFVGAIDPYVQALTKSGETWTEEDALVDFTLSLLRQPVRLERYQEAEIREKIARSVPLLPEMIPGLLDDILLVVNDNQLREHGKLGGRDLCDLFMTRRHLFSIAQTQIEPVPLRAPVTVWWAQQRSYQERERFSVWLGLERVQNYEIRGDHYTVVRSPETLSSLFRVLSWL